MALLGPHLVSAVEPLPDKLVVLTFDDSAKSHFTVARPVLKQHGFGATFFITEGFDFKTNKSDYMTWEQIAQLHREGFEIGNHTGSHLGITDRTADRLSDELATIRLKCIQQGIPAPTTFAWPGNAFTLPALQTLREHGILFARRGGAPEYAYKSGGGVAYEPGLDHPLLIPTAGDARPTWTLEDFKAAVSMARHGRAAVLQFHGVPDTAHEWVNTPKEEFAQYMQYLADHNYTVVALRDLATYVDPSISPKDPMGPITDRKERIAQGLPLDDSRPPKNDGELKRWLNNMHSHHRFHMNEIAAATGLEPAAIRSAIDRFGITPVTARREDDGRIRVLPYPGGRHPRIGFRDGAIRPQRETKFSVFTPWHNGGYAVVDLPEAIWRNVDEGRELLYLAHTHIPTYWDNRGKQLERLEWDQGPHGSLRVERSLPDGVAFGASVKPQTDGVAMELWLTNGSEQSLSGLRVQNCVMLAHAKGFENLDNDNKRFEAPYVACRNAAGDRWIITAWENCQRAWGNGPCPCMHSDPQFPDCRPGDTHRLHGWLSFYEGTDIDAELKRLRAELPF